MVSWSDFTRKRFLLIGLGNIFDIFFNTFSAHYFLVKNQPTNQHIKIRNNLTNSFEKLFYATNDFDLIEKKTHPKPQKPSKTIIDRSSQLFTPAPS